MKRFVSNFLVLSWVLSGLVFSTPIVAAAASKVDCLALIKVKRWEGTYSITGSNTGTASKSGFGYQWDIATQWTAKLTLNNLQSQQGTGACDLAFKPGPYQSLFQVWYLDGTLTDSSGSANGTEIVTNTCSSGKTSTREEQSTSTQTDRGTLALSAIKLTEGKLYIGDSQPGNLAWGGVDQGWLPTRVKDSNCMPGGDILNSTSSERVGPGQSPTIVVDLPAASSDMKIQGQRTFQTLGDMGIYAPVWDSPTTWTETWNLKPIYTDPPPPPKQEVEDPCLKAGSIIGCENRSLGQSVALGGTPYRLHYQSNRVAGALGVNTVASAYALDLGGWTLDVHHRYDPDTNTLFLGSGDFRNSDGLGTVTASSSSGFLIASEDGLSVYEFDSNGVHIKTRHALTGATLLSFAYNGAGSLISVTDGSGNVTLIARNALGKLVSITGPYGQVSKVTLNKHGYLTALTDPAGKSIKATYSASGLMTAFTDRRGSTSSFIHDASGLLVSDKNALAGKQTLASNGDIVTHTSALRRVTTYQTVIQADGSIERTVTQPNGLLNTSQKSALLAETVTSSNGMQTTSTPAPDPRFGNSARVVQTFTATTPGNLTHSIGATRMATLSDNADPFSLTQQTETLTRNGNVHTSVYDAASNIVTETSAAGRSSSHTIDGLGRVTVGQMAGRSAENLVYDAHGKLQSASIGSGVAARTTTYAYDASGYLASVTDPLNHVVSYINDKLGRPLQVTLSDGNTLKFAYDGEGNLTKLTNQAGKFYLFSYGKTGQLSSVTLPASKGAKTKQSYTYNTEDQMTGMVRLDGTKITYGYDAAGRLATLSAGAGAQTKNWSYSYDAGHGQLSAVTSPDGVTLGFTYDGQLLQSLSWTGLIAAQTEQVGLGYNTDFQIASVRVNGADAVSYAYDDDGLMTAAGNLTLQRHSQNGLRTGSTLGNVADAVSYNAFGEVSHYEASASAGALMTVDYSYDKRGRIIQRTETLLGGAAKTYDYSYDAVDRLSAVTEGTAITTYSYDKNGNRTKSAKGASTVTGSYDAQDRLLTYGDVKYGYSKNGEVASRSVGGDVIQLSYNALGNLVSATLSNGSLIEYVVDGSGMRVGRKMGGVLRQAFLYQGSLRPVAELDGSGNVVSRFVYATRVNVPDYLIKNGTTYRILTDHLGSPRLVVNVASGSVAQRIHYDEFGNVLNDTAPGFQPFGFSGGLYDPDTGLLHFGAREYDPKTGRWLAQDPLGFNSGSSNLYVYVDNDPVNYVDYIGQEGVKVGGTLYVTSKDVRLWSQADTSPRSDVVANLSVGDKVTWLGHVPGSKDWEKIAIVRPNTSGTACMSYTGYVLRQNLKVRPPVKDIDFTGRPMDSQSFPSHGAGTKG